MGFQGITVKVCVCLWLCKWHNIQYHRIFCLQRNKLTKISYRNLSISLLYCKVDMIFNKWNIIMYCFVQDIAEGGLDTAMNLSFSWAFGITRLQGRLDKDCFSSSEWYPEALHVVQQAGFWWGQDNTLWKKRSHPGTTLFNVIPYHFSFTICT